MIPTFLLAELICESVNKLLYLNQQKERTEDKTTAHSGENANLNQTFTFPGRTDRESKRKVEETKRGGKKAKIPKIDEEKKKQVRGGTIQREQ